MKLCTVAIAVAVFVLPLVAPLAATAKCSDTLIPSPNPGAYPSSLSGIAGLSDTDIWAVGYARYPPGTSQTLIEHWNGAMWSIVPSPNAPGASITQLSGVTEISTLDAWAIGGYNLRHFSFEQHQLKERWDGTAWTAFPENDEVTLASISSVPGDPTSVWAVGWRFPHCIPLYCPVLYMEHWNGTLWRVFGGGGPGQLNAVLALPHDTVWAVGYFIPRVGGSDMTAIVHRSHGKVSPIPTQGSALYGILSGVAGTSDQNVWIVGSRYSGSPIVEHWNGSGWTDYQIPHPKYTTVQSVSVASPTDVWIAGYHRTDPQSSSVYPYLAHWNGSTWTFNSRSPIGSDQGDISGLYQSTTGVWTAGFADLYNPSTVTETFTTFAHC